MAKPLEIFQLTENLLKQHFNHQSTAPYFLGLAVKSTTIHFPNGHYYWLTGPASSRGLEYEEERILAASGDLQIYATPVDFWDVGRSLLVKKFGSAFRIPEGPEPP